MTGRCVTCRHWAGYLAGLGECLEYVKRRQDAFAAAEDMAAFHAKWPRIAAPDKLATDGCDRHELKAVA